MIGIVGTKIVKFCAHDYINESVNMEFWLYEESQNENGFLIKLTNSIHELILVLPN
jgi:hypothetical protein